MGVLRRPPIPRDWRESAECKGYDPELWSCGDEGEEEHEQIARSICAEWCRVREPCLRQALRDENPNTTGVVRGGILFTGKRMLCYRCRYVVAPLTTGICAVCETYDPCLGGCGRMVRKDGDSWFCRECKVTEEELIG